MNEFFLVDFRYPPSLFSYEEYYKEKQRMHLQNKRSYIKITLFELELLKLLTVHKAFSTTQLLKLYNAYYPIERTPLRRKLSRWADKDIVSISSPSTTVVYYYDNVYSIGNEGIKLLVENGYLKKEYLREDIKEHRKIINFAHTVGQQDVAVELFSKLKKDDLFFESIRPTKYLSDSDISKYLLPDWILRYREPTGKHTMLFIEFDVGTERNKEVFGKFDSYIRLAKDNPERNMVVLFSVMDESFHYRGDKNVIGKQRLGNIKHFFLKDNKEVPPNLKFKISYRNRIQHIVKRDLIESDKNSVLDSLEVFLMDVMKYKIKDASNDGLYMRDVAEQFYADRLLEIYDNNGMLHERVGVIVVDEGDINCFIKVLGFYQALKDRLFKSSVSRLILIYENKSSLENDPYSYQFGKSVLLTDLESLSSGKKMIFREFINLNGTRNVSYTFKSKQPVSID